MFWRSAKRRCFKKLIKPKRPNDVHYYSSQKSWMTGDITNSVLTKIKRKMAAKRNILLFMDNAPCHPENFVVSYSNMKVVFLPKNTTSRLYPAGAIRNFKVKYQKRLFKVVVSWIDGNSKASEIIQKADVLNAIS